MKRITVSVTGNYRDAETTVRAKLALTKKGAQYAHICRRQIKAAADRCCYAGDDYPVFGLVKGYSDWAPAENGIVAYKLQSIG